MSPLRLTSLVLTPALLCGLGGSVLAQSATSLEFGWPFADHAVLQRDKPLPVWGSTDPGEMVIVDLGGHRLSTQADPDGAWEVVFPARPVSRIATTLSASAGTATVSCTDLLVGDVWVCAGQSNMNFHLIDATTGPAALPYAHHPLLRFCDRDGFVNHTRNPLTQAEFDRIQTGDYYQGTWETCTPTSASSFSAIGYFFGHQLVSRLGVPIGLIDISVHGSSTDGWVPVERLLNHPQFGRNRRSLRQSDEFRDQFNRLKIYYDLAPWLPARTRPRHYYDPGYLWEKGFQELSRQHIRGVLWYQGESNASDPATGNELFRLFLPALRDAFDDARLPFLYVQLPGLSYADWSEYREVQSSWLALPETEMVVSIDVADPQGVHPPQKQPIGNRLALTALKRAYNLPVAAVGPSFGNLRRQGTSLLLEFRNASGLRWAPGRKGHGFEIAGLDGIWHPAYAVIEKEGVWVSSQLVPSPVNVRYAWGNAPDWGLENGAALPAYPFRTRY